jgi:hypothetical protein
VGAFSPSVVGSGFGALSGGVVGSGNGVTVSVERATGISVGASNLGVAGTSTGAHPLKIIPKRSRAIFVCIGISSSSLRFLVKAWPLSGILPLIKFYGGTHGFYF